VSNNGSLTLQPDTELLAFGISVTKLDPHDFEAAGPGSYTLKFDKDRNFKQNTVTKIS
jgi:hypothetical protein